MSLDVSLHGLQVGPHPKQCDLMQWVNKFSCQSGSRREFDTITGVYMAQCCTMQMCSVIAHMHLERTAWKTLRTQQTNLWHLAEAVWKLLVHDEMPEQRTILAWLQSVHTAIVSIGMGSKLSVISSDDRVQIVRQVGLPSSCLIMIAILLSPAAGCFKWAVTISAVPCDYEFLSCFRIRFASTLVVLSNLTVHVLQISGSCISLKH